VYLPSLRVNIAVESTMVHRVQLQCNVDELGGKYTEAEPRCTCRVNIAEESVEDHRVQLQCKFDEMEGKYTEAKPRCTCPSYESNLHQVGEVQHLLPLDLMLVHFRPHLCSGYTDQYHSFLQKVKSSMITEQNGILIHHGIFVFHIIYFYCKDNTVTST
jgi:predicted nucleic acid-binding Zn finger protein